MSLIPVHALHALAYCERLYYLENVEGVRVADAAVYAGRRLHTELEGDDDEDHDPQQPQPTGFEGGPEHPSRLCPRRKAGSAPSKGRFSP